MVGVSGQEKQPEIAVSPEEMKALNAINAMTDPAAKLKAIDDFLKKYPKTPARMKIAEAVAGEIANDRSGTGNIARRKCASALYQRRGAGIHQRRASGFLASKPAEQMTYLRWARRSFRKPRRGSRARTTGIHSCQ